MQSNYYMYSIYEHLWHSKGFFRSDCVKKIIWATARQGLTEATESHHREMTYKGWRAAEERTGPGPCFWIARIRSRTGG